MVFLLLNKLNTNIYWGYIYTCTPICMVLRSSFNWIKRTLKWSTSLKLKDKTNYQGLHFQKTSFFFLVPLSGTLELTWLPRTTSCIDRPNNQVILQTQSTNWKRDLEKHNKVLSLLLLCLFFFYFTFFNISIMYCVSSSYTYVYYILPISKVNWHATKQRKHPKDYKVVHSIYERSMRNWFDQRLTKRYIFYMSIVYRISLSRCSYLESLSAPVVCGVN